MPKMTDYVRKGFKKRRRLWEGGEVPEWWDIAVWVSLAGVIAIIVISVLTESGGGGTAAGSPPPYHVQSLNPYAQPTPTASSVTSSGTPSAQPSGSAPDSPSSDFSATAAVQVAMTGGGGTAIVPAGARNVALAAAKAEATGDWKGIPFVGVSRPPAAARTPQGTVTGEITVENPSVTGNGSYLFSTTITHGPGTKSFLVQIAVQRMPTGYAIVAR